MEYLKEMKKNPKKDFSAKDAVFGFSSLTFICIAIIFSLIVYEVLTIRDFLSLDKPLEMVMIIIRYSIGLILFGIILTLSIPAKYIDDTNKSYPNFSLSAILSFMFIGALFEELLFRGIIQNVIYIFIGNQWIAIITTSLLFIGFHIQYFKKPIMLINLIVPSLIYGWIYFETNNILVPFLVHFLTNLGITLLFKYNLVRFKR